EGASYQYFARELTEPLRIRCVQPPMRRVPLSEVFTAPDGRDWLKFWDRCRGAAIDVWTFLDQEGRPPVRRYKVGVDVSAGSGASNSVISVGDCQTGEQVAEFAWPHITPTELAHVAMAICQWFSGLDESGPEIIWEDR